MSPEITSLLSLLLASFSLAIALYTLLSPAIRSTTTRIKTPGVNFPENPEIRDTLTYGEKTWRYTGSVWKLEPKSTNSPKPDETLVSN